MPFALVLAVIGERLDDSGKHDLSDVFAVFLFPFIWIADQSEFASLNFEDFKTPEGIDYEGFEQAANSSGGAAWISMILPDFRFS